MVIRNKSHKGVFAKGRVCFENLDEYICNIHAASLAQKLDSIAAFGQRLTRLVNRTKQAKEWWLTRDILIQRRHLALLCRRVIRFTCTINSILEKPDISTERNSAIAKPPVAPIFCRDRGCLQAATQRMSQTYESLAVLCRAARLPVNPSAGAAPRSGHVPPSPLFAAV